MTAIIGPNGCGKGDIIDTILSLSATKCRGLRGDRMEDVIFGGDAPEDDGRG